MASGLPALVSSGAHRLPPSSTAPQLPGAAGPGAGGASRGGHAQRSRTRVVIVDAMQPAACINPHQQRLRPVSERSRACVFVDGMQPGRRGGVPCSPWTAGEKGSTHGPTCTAAERMLIRWGGVTSWRRSSCLCHHGGQALLLQWGWPSEPVSAHSAARPKEQRLPHWRGVGAATHATPTERTTALWREMSPQEGALRGASQNTVTGMCCSRLRCVSRSCQWGLGWRRWDADMCGAVPQNTFFGVVTLYLSSPN